MQPMSVSYSFKYLTLETFCTCSQTYQKYRDRINPYPDNLEETLPALIALNEQILDPTIEQFGFENFQLTYGFCSKNLKRFLERKDPTTGKKNGRVAPRLDQHMACERNRNGDYYCPRLGAACDFRILNVGSDRVVDWILAARLPFDSLYFYGSDRPIHVSYSSQYKQDLWTFTATGQPTRKGIEHWVKILDERRSPV
ncbi:hypothetical protein JJD41_19195 [Oxynema sp. CENA135]|nr:hypothetical protein [Oxynema sp. CENA135]MBK4731979.1 hypothetical protein [Oxynema sp. CENA135]